MSGTPPPPAPPFYDATHLAPEDSVGYLMRKVITSIRSQVDAGLAAHGLTYTQWLPLFKLSLCQTSTTVAGLARELETDPAAMTRVLDRLEAKGLVRRERATHDRRVVQLALTPAGQAMAAQVPPVLASVLNAHLSDFTHEEWQLLLRLLRRMLANGSA
ncbi:MarR family winged helix-turn-helix transcriptional regulator [Comamonas granuli]|uniref:MarR family winged helix-turn-helix transcriptional regulator n=1 Tax=Comamonas granuli TaxID=290309 RepID=UPI0005A75AF5|nr:MarR family transcriptional regulator [Comamonas granuli]